MLGGCRRGYHILRKSLSLEAVEHAVVNTLAMVSGIMCDSAKASCAAKIASSVDTAIMGLSMYRTVEHSMAVTWYCNRTILRKLSKEFQR